MHFECFFISPDVFGQCHSQALASSYWQSGAGICKKDSQDFLVFSVVKEKGRISSPKHFCSTSIVLLHLSTRAGSMVIDRSSRNLEGLTSITVERYPTFFYQESQSIRVSLDSDCLSSGPESSIYQYYQSMTLGKLPKFSVPQFPH